MTNAAAMVHSVAPLVLLVLAVSGGALALHLLGVIDLPFLREPTPEFVVPAGKIAVPISGREIPAYTKLTRDHVWNPSQGRVAVVFIDQDQAEGRMLTRLDQILGRVLKNPKPAGYVFTDADFLPKGTRPGLVAGIPPGKRALRVDLGAVEGLFGLNAGDRFDLVATLPLDRGALDRVPVDGALGSQVRLRASLGNWQQQATVRVVAQNAVVVSPLVTRAVPLSTPSMTQGVITRTKPVQEMVIGIDPGEVPVVTEALAIGARVSCVPRSGHPDDPTDSVTPPLQPWSPFTGDGGRSSGALGGLSGDLTFVERIDGSERSIIAVPD